MATSDGTSTPEDLISDIQYTSASTVDPLVEGSAVGDDDPTMSYNLSGVADYSAEHPFIDLMKYSRPFVASDSHSYGVLDHAYLEENGYLDEHGWPTEIPPGMKEITTAWAFGSADVFEGMAGRYVVEWEGEGTIRISGKGEIVEQSGNRIVFELTDPGNLILNISRTDPDGTGDYIRDITVMKEEHVELYEAGQIFNPDFIDVVSDARELRFMHWMKTIGNDVDSWDQRREPDDVSYMSVKGEEIGVPVEIMVELANQTGTDPWFSIPLNVDSDYVRKFAEYVRDNLDPGLRATFETGNEIWNATYPGLGQLRAMVDAAGWEPGGSDFKAVLNMYAMLATANAQIVDDVFGADAEDRAYNVLGSQRGSPWSTIQLLDPVIWQQNEPETYVDPTGIFDAVAVTSYFGSATLSKGYMRAELEAVLADPEIDAMQWLADKLMDPDYIGSIPETLSYLNLHKKFADAAGLDIVLYEGGQHVVHRAGIADVDPAVRIFLHEFVRSEYMTELYQALWDGWEEIGDGAFNQFHAVGAPSSWGAFGVRYNLYDDNERVLLLEELSKTTSAWWEDRGGEHFQQGVTTYGTDAADDIAGTTQEDFLLGGAGNDRIYGGGENDGLHGGDGDDILIGGAGSDHIAGGEGVDTAVYGRDFEAYQVSIGEFVEVVDTVTGDVDTLSGVEFLQFTNGLYEVALEAFTPGGGDVSVVIIETPEDGDSPTGDTDPPATTPDDGDTPAGDTDPPVATPDDGDTPAGDTDPPVATPDDGDSPAGGGGTQGDTPVDDPSDFEIVYGTAGYDMFEAQATSGLMFGSINIWSATGQNLLSQEGADIRDTPIYYVTSRDWAYVMGDNDGPTGHVPYDAIHGNGLDVALQNAGIMVGVEAITGSAFADKFSGQNADDWVDTGGGNDALLGRGGRDILSGGAGNDYIDGGAGDDVLIGGAGNDRLFGGSGEDTAVYDGDFDAYEIVAGTELLVVDTATGDTDRLNGVETLLFADGTFDPETGVFVPDDHASALESVLDAALEDGLLLLG